VGEKYVKYLAALKFSATDPNKPSPGGRDRRSFAPADCHAAPRSLRLPFAGQINTVFRRAPTTGPTAAAVCHSGFET